MGAIYRREMRAYFTTPVGYVFLAVFLAVCGFAFSMSTLEAGANSSVATYFVYCVFIFAIVLPILTMKLFSEDRKNSTEQILLTSPVSLTGIVMGKFLAAETVFAGALGLNGLNYLLLYKYAELPAYGSPTFFELQPTELIIGNILGLLFLGTAFIAIGTFISSLTENQITAVIVTVLATVVLTASSLVTDYINNEALRVIVKWISVLSRLTSLTSGLLDVTTFIYFISFVAVFLFLTVRVYERRRWA